MSDKIILKDIPLSTPVKVEGGEALFTQSQLAEIYGLDLRTINDHIKHMEEDGELEKSSIRSYRITAKDGKSYAVNHYNVDVAYDLGFKVRNSARALKS